MAPVRPRRGDWTPPAARWVGVTKDLGGRTVLAGLDATVGSGEVVVLLGPNGAGKTTSVHVLLGLRRPTEGCVEVLGGAPTDLSVRARVGWVAQESSFPETLTGADVRRLVAAHHPDRPIGEGVFTALGLDVDLLGRRTGALSGGQRRRLSCALALAAEPDLLVLDEPTTGVDPEHRWALWDLITEADARERGRSVLVCTNDLHEAERLADRVVVLGGGRVVFAGTIGDLRATRPAPARLSVRVDDPTTARAVPALVPGLEEVGPGRLAGPVDDGDAAVRALVAAEVAFRDLEVRPVTLDELLRGGWAGAGAGGA